MASNRRTHAHCSTMGFCLLMIASLPTAGHAEGVLTSEPNPNSYHYVSHYAVRIDAPADVVWPHLRRLNEWMYEFELSQVAGTPGTEGEVRRLYAAEDFLIQVTHQIPDKLLVIANLPSRFEGEDSTGVAVITLNESDGSTIVDLTMSRRYTWRGEGDDPQRARRASAAFSEQSRAMWQDRFLGRLRSLAEAP